MKVAGVIAAGGTGKRFGAEMPKQFHYLKGKPVLAWSIEAFEKVPYVEEVVIAAPEGWEDITKRILQGFSLRLHYQVVTGGVSRAQSVLNGLMALSNDMEWVAVHDAARPGILPQQIEEAILLAREIGAAIVAVQAADTVKIVDSSGLIVKTIPRKDVRLAQTPQVARIKDLIDAYEADKGSFLGATDEASVLERMGIPVGVVDGGVNNMKITRPEDIRFLEGML